MLQKNIHHSQEWQSAKVSACGKIKAKQLSYVIAK